MNTRKISLFEPDFGPEEESAVVAVLRSGWIAAGPRVEAFEERFAAMLGAPFALATSSCTASLHLASLIAGVGPGDEVIVPSLTFAATANAQVYCGAKPVFADIASDDDWTLDPADVAAKVTARTKAIVPMHYAGAACDMTALGDIARRHGLAIIEDACHGLGSTLDGKALGTIGDSGCFSFYSNKIMTTGEGGMIVLRDPDVARRAKRLRSHGQNNVAIDRVRGAQHYDISEVGYNYRLDDLRAAIGLVQLDRMDWTTRRRAEIVAEYELGLRGIGGVRIPRHGSRGTSAHYILPVLLDEGLDRDRVRASLAAAGVQTSLHYPPVHLFSHYRTTDAVSLPVTERVARRTLTLPLYPRLSKEDVAYVCDALGEAVDLARGA